jgi:hypothetical protein
LEEGNLQATNTFLLAHDMIVHEDGTARRDIVAPCERRKMKDLLPFRVICKSRSEAGRAEEFYDG